MIQTQPQPAQEKQTSILHDYLMARRRALLTELADINRMLGIDKKPKTSHRQT